MARITRERYAALMGEPEPQRDRLISKHNFTDLTPRTLAYGYTCERNTWHLYLLDDGLHLFVYRKVGDDAIEVGHLSGMLHEDDLAPDKRLYPQYTDGEYVALMRRLDLPMPFTTWRDPDDRGVFAGKTHEEC